MAKPPVPTGFGRLPAQAATSPSKPVPKSPKQPSKGGDRKSQDFHMIKANEHMQKALQRRLAQRDK